MLSCYFIVKNAENTFAQALASVKKLADEIIVIDDGSTDSSPFIAKKYGAKVFSYVNPSEGEKRIFAVKQCKGDWILCLDADEVVSPELGKEIKEKLLKTKHDGFIIPYRNHFLGHVLKHGGEQYAIMRLFKKKASRVENTPIHAFHIVDKNKVGHLKGEIYHYSYQSIWQLYKKFTNYAFKEADRKIKNEESTSLKKVTMYPVHMFWARFVKDKGYKDGIIRIPLDLGFAYMEWLTYMIMFFKKI